MKNVLYVEASPRKQRSASIEVASAFLSAAQKAAPDLLIDRLDVWSEKLPEFDGAALSAKYAGLEGRERTLDERRVWEQIEALGARFKAADTLVFSIPMWNWTVPYKLKHLIDAVSQKDVLFTFDEHGLNGLLGGRKAVCIYARGVEYTSGTAMPAAWDQQRPFMETWLASIGIADVKAVLVEKTLLGPEPDRVSREAACGQARALAEVMARG